MDSFSYLEPVCCSMSSSNCCFLTCIQVSQEAGQVVLYSHLFQNFPQFIHPLKLAKWRGEHISRDIDRHCSNKKFNTVHWLFSLWNSHQWEMRRGAENLGFVHVHSQGHGVSSPVLLANGTHYAEFGDPSFWTDQVATLIQPKKTAFSV